MTPRSVTSVQQEFEGVYATTGVFVCFEGGEGSGKSTQSALLGEWLRERGVRRTPHLRARRHRGRPSDARDRARPGDRRAVPPHRVAALRRRQVRARRHRRAARARPGRGRGHRPLRRLDARLPGSRPRPRRRRGRAGCPVGHPRPAAPPHRRPRPRARARPRQVRGARPDRGGVAGLPRAGPGVFLTRAKADADHYARARRPVAGRGHRGRRSATGSGPCCDRPGDDQRLGRPGRPAPGHRRPPDRRGRPGHEPRLAVHRPARLRPVQRRHRLRGRAAVRGRRLRRLPRLPHGAGRHPRRRHPSSAPRSCRSGSPRCATWSAAPRSLRSAAAGRS